MNALPPPSPQALAAYRRWRTTNGHGAIPDGDEHDTAIWCAGYDWRASQPLGSSQALSEAKETFVERMYEKDYPDRPATGSGPDAESPDSWARTTP
jgi:hypothetical protein